MVHLGAKHILEMRKAANQASTDLLCQLDNILLHALTPVAHTIQELWHEFELTALLNRAPALLLQLFSSVMGRCLFIKHRCAVVDVEWGVTPLELSNIKLFAGQTRRIRD